MSKKLMLQILKFVVVGATAFLIDYGILMLLTKYAMFNHLLANVISFTISVLNNYYLSTTWVFESQQKQSQPVVLVVFIVMSVIGLLLNTAVIFVCVDYLKIFSLTISKVLATGVVMVYNFVSRKIYFEGVK